MSAFGAVVYREARIRATNLLFIFWDVCYPLGYLLVFGVGVSGALGFTAPGLQMDYNTFFLAGVLAMASFGIAANTVVVVLPGPRQRHVLRDAAPIRLAGAPILVAKVLFNVAVAVVQAFVTVLLAALLLGVPCGTTCCRSSPRRSCSGRRAGSSSTRPSRSGSGATTRSTRSRRSSTSCSSSSARCSTRSTRCRRASRRRLREPDHLAHRRAAVCDGGPRGPPAWSRRKLPRSCVFAAASFVAALLVLERQE